MRAAVIALLLVPSLASAARMPKLPLSFIRNVGQTHPSVGWMAKGAGADLYFASEEVVLVEPPGECGAGSVVRLRFEGASKDMRLEGLEALPGTASFRLGNVPENWRERVPMHAGIAYRDAWPGIDVLYRGTDGRLKADFEVAPGARVSDIRLSFEGVTALRLRADGALILETPTGQLVEEAPTSWEERPGGRRELASRFVLLGGARVGLAVDGRDPSAKLVIDPVLDYASHLGGSEDERVVGISHQHAVGSTRSPDFPVTLGAPPAPGTWDVYELRPRRRHDPLLRVLRRQRRRRPRRAARERPQREHDVHRSPHPSARPAARLRGQRRHVPRHR